MRGILFSLSFAVLCGGAQASSIVVMGGAAPASTPSFVSLAGATLPAPATASIVALGDPGTSPDKVAAIPQPRLPPMVIRGGVVGGQSAPSPAKLEPADATDTAASTDNAKPQDDADEPESEPKSVPG